MTSTRNATLFPSARPAPDRLSRSARGLALAVALSVGWCGVVSTAQAGTVSAQAVAQAAAEASPLQQRLMGQFDRSDVQQALIERGVDPTEARLRIAALSDAQAQDLMAQIDAAPAGAGGDILGAIVFVFLLLLVTDILGFTKVYPFTRSIR
ncbi:MAG: PA2779 family protein [Leptothrix sp. (in: b-proteobacteria)]